MLRPLTRCTQHLAHQHYAVTLLPRMLRATQQSRRLQRFPTRRHASTEVESVAATTQEVAVAAQLSSSAFSLNTFSHVLRLPMEYVHDTLSIPWLWVIPLSAFAIRAILFYPITFTTRKALQRRLALSPLISAHKPWYRLEARALARRDATKGLAMHQRTLLLSLTRKMMGRYACGYGRTFFLPMLQLPVFLSMSWTIREMQGMEGGALKSLTYSLFGGASTTGASMEVVPGMTTEGLPWALDLTAADPTGTLSYVVAAIMLSQTLLGSRSVREGTNVLTRLLIILSLCIGPMMASAPVGILYYWACSSGIALVTNLGLDWWYPLKRFKPCRRPLVRLGVAKR